MYDDFEEDRLEHLQIAKSRGKGAPKKKNSKNGEFVFFLEGGGKGMIVGFAELTFSFFTAETRRGPKKKR